MGRVQMRYRGLGNSGWRIVAICFLVAVMATACGGAQATPTAEPATSTVEPVVKKAEWDLVLLSDSSGWGVADRYAAHIEEDLDVTVNVRDLAADSLGAGSVLAALRGEGGPYPSSVDVAGLVREADE